MPTPILIKITEIMDLGFMSSEFLDDLKATADDDELMYLTIDDKQSINKALKDLRDFENPIWVDSESLKEFFDVEDLNAPQYNFTRGGYFKTLKFFYNDSFLYSLDNMKHFYCFNESEVKSKENSLLLPWDNLLKDCYFIDENLIPIPLTERYTHKVVKLHRIEYKGRFYYIGCS